MDSQLNSVEELLPKEITNLLEVMPLGEALRAVHNLTQTRGKLSSCKTKAGNGRAHCQPTSIKKNKKNNTIKQSYCFNKHKVEKINLIKQLPFTLTNSQERVVREIEEDLMLPRPMMRLTSRRCWLRKNYSSSTCYCHSSGK